MKNRFLLIFAVAYVFSYALPATAANDQRCVYAQKYTKSFRVLYHVSIGCESTPKSVAVNEKEGMQTMWVECQEEYKNCPKEKRAITYYVRQHFARLPMQWNTKSIPVAFIEEAVSYKKKSALNMPTKGQCLFAQKPPGVANTINFAVTKCGNSKALREVNKNFTKGMITMWVKCTGEGDRCEKDKNAIQRYVKEHEGNLPLSIHMRTTDNIGSNSQH